MLPVTTAAFKKKKTVVPTRHVCKNQCHQGVCSDLQNDGVVLETHNWRMLEGMGMGNNVL